MNISDLYHEENPAEIKDGNKALIIVTDEGTVEKILHFLKKNNQLNSTLTLKNHQGK